MTASPFNTLRIYISGSFQDVPLPDWYVEAEQLADKEMLDWMRSVAFSEPIPSP